MIKWKNLIFSIAISLGVGLLSSLLTRGNQNIYEVINVPSFAPPSWLFPVVWTILYIMMGISAAMIYLNRTSDFKKRTAALATYASSLIVNFAWSIIFFNFRAFFLAFIWLLLLFYLLVKSIVQYRPIDRVAAYLQIPYVLWVAFAGYLSFGIWILN